MNLVWETDLPLTRKMVMVSLADQGNDHGEAYPGINSMMRRCSMARATLYGALAELEADGWLSRETFGGGRNTLYRINLARLTQTSLLPANGPSAGPSSNRTVQHVDRPAGRPSSSGKTEGPAGGLHKSNQKQKQPVGSARTRAEQLEVMGAYDRGLIASFIPELPEAIELQLFADFVRHVQVKRGPLSISSWWQLRDHLRSLLASGVDLNASLRETMLLQLVVPIDPRKKPGHRGGAPPTRPKVNDDFSNVSYAGTPDDELPAELRTTEPADAG